MRTVVSNDFHGQFRDKTACKLFFGFLEREKPDQLILNGDIVDFYSISRFDKDPARKEDLQDELNNVYNFLVDIRNTLPEATVVYTEGNHEARLRKYLRSKAPALATLDALQIESLLGLESLGIRYEEDGVWVGDLYVYHGSIIRSKSGFTAHAEMDKNGCSGMSGHSHRDAKAGSRKRGGQLVWFENFCMCQLDAEYIVGIANWTQGWSVVTTCKKRPTVEQVAVLGGRYNYRGIEYNLKGK